MKKTIALALAALVGAALFIPATANAKKAKGPVVLGTDEAGDWGAAAAPDPALVGPYAQLGDELGMDLTKASIGPGEDGTLNFILTVNSLPSQGGTPEIARYSWDFSVDGEEYELDGKFTNYSRGVCDPTSGACPPPRDPGQQPFFLRGNCVTEATANVTTCEELAVIKAIFDPAEGTITIPASLELLGAKPGSKITPGVGIFGGTIEAAPAAFFSRSDMPADVLTITKTYVVPKK